MALINERARILSNECVGPNLYLMELSAPEIALTIKPGQFVHMKIPGMSANILRRPFSIYARDKAQGTLEILYQALGVGSNFMTTLVPHQTQDAELIGPIGRTWQPPQEAKRALLVGGGVGAAPLFMLCEELIAAGVETDVIIGAQTEQALACRERYEKLLPKAPSCATDDGTFGYQGFCTPLVEESLALSQKQGAPYDYVAVCGPEPLMKIVSEMALAADVFCEISLEKRMACGVGACLSCVVDTTEGRQRACVDGPVFEAQKVVW